MSNILSGKRHISILAYSTTIFLVVCFCLMVSLAGAWLYLEYEAYKEDIATTRDTLEGELKRIMQNEVDDVIEYIVYMKSKVESRASMDIQERTLEAHAVATRLYGQYKDTMTEEKLKVLVREALRDLRYNDGLGYFFATDFTGHVWLLADRPELEGKNLLEIRDTNGRQFIKDFIAIAKSKGEGFTQYTWTKPGKEERDYQKLAYVKRFDPFDWFIGTGLYLDDTEREVQREVLDRIGRIRFEPNGYIFVATYNGINLSHANKAFIGKDHSGLQNMDGVFIVREMSALARKGGGFFRYRWDKPDSETVIEKISYVRGFDSWGWFIGTGIYTDDAEKAIDRHKQVYTDHIKLKLAVMAGMLLAVSVIVLLVGRYYGNRLRISFASFNSFFNRAATEAVTIDPEEQYFTDFQNLAVTANRMVAEREALTTELKQGEQKYRRLIDTTETGFVIVDNDGTVLDANLLYVSLSGHDHLEEIKGRSIVEWTAPNQKETNAKAVAQCFEQGFIRDFQVDYEWPDGTRRSIEVNATVEIVKDRSEMHALCRDITRRKRSEELLIQTEKMMSVGGLAAGMAHEINNPLGGILQGSQNIIRRVSDDFPANLKTAQKRGIALEDVRGYLEDRGVIRTIEDIRDAAKRAAEIVKNMLSFSRRSGHEFSVYDLAMLLDETVTIASTEYDLKKNYDFRKIDIIREYAPETPGVYCERGEIQQVFLNILRNGAQAMAEKDYTEGVRPAFCLRVNRSGGFVVVEIEDNGPGLGETERKRVFEPFYTTKDVGKGTGLGLSVSYFIITEQHHGSLEVASIPGEWTRFTIVVPIKGQNSDDQ